MVEIKEIPGYNRRFVAFSYGKIYDNKYGEFVKLTKDSSNGYWKCNLGSNDNGFPDKVFLHRMIAFTFIPNPNNLESVNHIDCNKDNNKVSNLEWCTVSYNTKHAFANNLHNNRYYTYDKETIIELCKYLSVCNSYENINDIAKKFGMTRQMAGDIYNRRRHKDISKDYTFVKLKSSYKQSVSDEEIKNICELLEEGKKYKEISELTDRSVKFISDIKRRVKYTEISKDYKF